MFLKLVDSLEKGREREQMLVSHLMFYCLNAVLVLGTKVRSPDSSPCLSSVFQGLSHLLLPRVCISRKLKVGCNCPCLLMHSSTQSRYIRFFLKLDEMPRITWKILNQRLVLLGSALSHCL